MQTSQEGAFMGIGQQVKIQLIKKENIQGTDGRNNEVASQTYNLWAEVSSTSSFRSAEHSQTQIGSTKRFKLRYRFDRHPNCDWKVKYLGKDWTVTEISRADEKRFFWFITATTHSNV